MDGRAEKEGQPMTAYATPWWALEPTDSPEDYEEATPCQSCDAPRHLRDQCHDVCAKIEDFEREMDHGDVVH